MQIKSVNQVRTDPQRAFHIIVWFHYVSMLSVSAVGSSLGFGKGYDVLFVCDASCLFLSLQQAKEEHQEYQRWPLSIQTYPSPIALPEGVSGPLFFISVDSKKIFSVKPIPHLSSDIVSRLPSVLISHYLCSVTDHNSSHTHTHTHVALTLARSFIFCREGSAELADIFTTTLQTTVFHKIQKASHVDTFRTPIVNVFQVFLLEVVQNIHLPSQVNICTLSLNMILHAGS